MGAVVAFDTLFDGRAEGVAENEPGVERAVGPVRMELLRDGEVVGDVVVENLVDEFAREGSPDWGHGYGAGGFFVGFVVVAIFSLEMVVGVPSFHGCPVFVVCGGRWFCLGTLEDGIPMEGDEVERE